MASFNSYYSPLEGEYKKSNLKGEDFLVGEQAI
jgi:hypothetical protein